MLGLDGPSQPPAAPTGAPPAGTFASVLPQAGNAELVSSQSRSSQSRGVVVPIDGASTTPEIAISAGTGLSPTKLLEMSEQFQTATAATANVDQDGTGQAAAVHELAGLLSHLITILPQLLTT